MKDKKFRQAEIVKLLERKQITTQYQLQRLLMRTGYDITQATLSRDMKELGVTYARGVDGLYYYMIPRTQAGPSVTQDLKNRIARYTTAITHTGNLILVKTLPGEAAGTARLIDEISNNGLSYKEFKQVLGTVAGDDTILMVVKQSRAVTKIINRLKSFKGDVKSR
jgi:transcriptional regulator of arginine metabolism